MVGCLSSIGEVAHYAIRANFQIDALTMLEHAWQNIVGCCAVFLFSRFFDYFLRHMTSCRDRAQESTNFLWQRIFFECTCVDLNSLSSFRLFWDFMFPAPEKYADNSSSWPIHDRPSRTAAWSGSSGSCRRKSRSSGTSGPSAATIRSIIIQLEICNFSTF